MKSRAEKRLLGNFETGRAYSAAKCPIKARDFGTRSGCGRKICPISQTNDFEKLLGAPSADGAIN